MAFATTDSPVLEEYLSFVGSPQPEYIPPIGPDDALVIIDMQHDFLLKEAVTNPDGGRFGAPEGNQCIAPIVDMISLFVERGGHVIATRDYHPHDHKSFFTNGGPYPPHCVQGTPGARLVPEIAEALAKGVRAAGTERVSVCFKGMHEQVDSFGALPYFKGGHHLAPRNTGAPGLTEKGMPRGCCVGCTAAPWTGSIFLKQSAILGPLSGKADFGAIDMNAPPDLCALLGDDEARSISNLQDVLRKRKRLFVCGLCLDVCVLDTCVNAAACGFKGSTYMVVDACRAAHVHGLGTFGSGFLYDPQAARQKMDDAQLRFASVAGVLGAAAMPHPVHQPSVRFAGQAFPGALAPLGLEAAMCSVVVDGTAGRYVLSLDDGLLAAVGYSPPPLT